tara:strand:- start:149 stop:868 length:720 start_codon:yes stop_codon:yes gene_type:complete
MKKSINRNYIKTLLAVISGLIICNPSNANDNKKIEIQDENKAKIIEKSRYVEYMFGAFYDGPYIPYQIKKQKFDYCSSLTLCDIKKRLYGSTIGFRLIDKKATKGNHKFDIDKIFLFSLQAPETSKNQTIKSNLGGSNRAFGMISYVPTYRYDIKQLSERVSVGVGTGINLAIGQVPSELPDNNPLKSQLNIEVAYNISSKEKTSAIVLGLQHRCNLFGLIGGKLKGRQWYTIGFRHAI